MNSRVIATGQLEAEAASNWRTIIEPRRGSHLTFEVTGAESGGEFVRLHDCLPPHSSGPPRHIHCTQSESFRVFAGRLRVESGGRAVIIGPGEEVTVPAGVPHTFRTEGDEEVELAGEVRPAGQVEAFLRALYGLSRDGRMDPINFAMAARLGDTLPAGLPRPVARLLISLLAWSGDRLGRDGSFPEYTTAPGSFARHQ